MIFKGMKQESTFSDSIEEFKFDNPQVRDFEAATKHGFVIQTDGEEIIIDHRTISFVIEMVSRIGWFRFKEETEFKRLDVEDIRNLGIHFFIQAYSPISLILYQGVYLAEEMYHSEEAEESSMSMKEVQQPSENQSSS